MVWVSYICKTHHLIFKSFRESISLPMTYLLYRKESYHRKSFLTYKSRPRAVKTVAVRLLNHSLWEFWCCIILWPSYSIKTTLDFRLDIWFKSWGYFKSHNLNIQICVEITFFLSLILEKWLGQQNWNGKTIRFSWTED